MSRDNKPVNVMGPGAIGIGIAVLIANQGYDVALLGRDGPVRTASLNLKGREFGATFSETAHTNQAHTIIVSKAYDLDGIISLNHSLLASSETILYLQNGLGLERKFEPFPQAFQGILWVSAERPQKGHALWRTGLRIVLDGSDTRAKGAGAILTEAGISIDFSAQFQSEIFRKLMINLACNPVSVLYGITNSAIHLHPEARTRAILAAGEIAGLAKRLGHAIDLDPTEIVDGIAAKAGDFKSSTLQDYEAGRPLELEAILLEPIMAAKELDMRLPQVTSLYEDLTKISTR